MENFEKLKLSKRKTRSVYCTSSPQDDFVHLLSDKTIHFVLIEHCDNVETHMVNFFHYETFLYWLNVILSYQRDIKTTKDILFRNFKFQTEHFKF
jgi:hypothetical protein